MSEENLRKSLIGQGQTGGIAPEEIAARVIRRDRWIMRILAGGTILLWTIAAAGILTFHFGFITFVLPSMREWAATGGTDPRFSRISVYWIYTYGSPLITASACALVLAAIGTVGLILFSRRASLRQINQSLAIIADQLRELAQQPRPQAR